MTDAIATAPPPLSDGRFTSLVEAEASGYATAEQLATLEADTTRWTATLVRLLHDTEDGLESVRHLTGPEREQVIADFESERLTIRAALARRTGEPDDELDNSRQFEHDDNERSGGSFEPEEIGTIALQLSWSPGRVVAWAAGPGVAPSDFDDLRARLETAGAPSSAWGPHEPVTLPNGAFADALSAPVGDVLGWLMALGAGTEAATTSTPIGANKSLDNRSPADDVDLDTTDYSVTDPAAVRAEIARSARWLGRIAVWAVELTMQGAVVPLLGQRKRNRSGKNDSVGTFSVRWTPAVIDPDKLRVIADAMPTSVTVLDQTIKPQTATRSALTGMVDAIGRNAAKLIEVPAPPPRPRSPTDVAEAFLGHLDGAKFEAPLRVGNDLVSELERWARPVMNPGGNGTRLVVQLDPPDSSNAWKLAILAPDRSKRLVSVEVALVNGGSKRVEMEEQLARAERLLPMLRRAGGTRRGEVILSQAEAWDLMTETGPLLVAAGFDVRVPELSMKKATPSLRLQADPSTPSVVGAHQLANVSWSALFDDVELSAADIARLAKEARPLVRSKGRWVALDHADLEQAAAALAERSEATQLTGAEMLRHALGLEGSALAGGISVEGSGWAADLLSRASTIGTEPAKEPEGFEGELRSYQGEALAWLGFLDSVDLGGCLALDMGLGKTPTMLAHLQAGTNGGEHIGPALVIAPPAVVGNWAAEAARFTPDLRVVVHHGANRAEADEIAKEVAVADVVITTYGTAVRDIEALETVTWERLVLDEAQAIKNPANDTAQQLRRIKARSKLALTGTPIENGLGDLHAILDFTNPGLVGPRPQFIAHLSEGTDSSKRQGEDALRALNGILVFRRTKSEPEIAAELPDRIDELDHCAMTPEQIGLYQAVLDSLITGKASGATPEEGDDDSAGQDPKKGAVLAAITALKQICNHPAAYHHDGSPLEGRSGKLARLDEIVEAVFAADERVLVFTHFAEWGQRLAVHLSERTNIKVNCYHGGLSRGARDAMISEFQNGTGPGCLVLSLKAGGTGLNLTAASHVVLYDRWWNPAVEDQARDRVWRIGQTKTVIAHRLVCPGTVDERVEEVVAGKRRIADMVLPKSSSLADLDSDQLRTALGLRPDQLLTDDDPHPDGELTGPDPSPRTSKSDKADKSRRSSEDAA